MAWPGFDSTLPRHFEHRRGHIDSDDLSVWTDHLRGDQAIEASTAADIDDPLTGLEVADAKGVARAGERRYRAFGNISSEKVLTLPPQKLIRPQSEGAGRP